MTPQNTHSGDSNPLSNQVDNRSANAGVEHIKVSRWWWLWRFRSHSHGKDNMKLIEEMPMHYYGGYQIYQCRKCGFVEAL